MVSFLQENLSRRTTAVLTQSSTYETSIASKANDGKIELIHCLCSYCAKSQEGMATGRLGTIL